MRYLLSELTRDLAKKMVLLCGPRQCGKTTFAKSLLDSKGIYLNWDVGADRKIIKQMLWPKDASLVVLDELHKMPKWKNFLKGVSDEFNNSPPILVTGSARLDLFRKAGDALTGRHFFYHLHPFDLVELNQIYPKTKLNTVVDQLIQAGGFPESFLNAEDAPRLRNDRFELVVKEDLRDISRISTLSGALDLIELLRERVGKPVQYDSLAQDLLCSPPTVKKWIGILEQLYLIFLLRPYSPSSLATSIRKEKRVFFMDCSAAYDDSQGAHIENIVACSLLKYVHFKRDSTGQRWDLFYIRDKQKREVDFVLIKDRKVEKLIEVKKSEESLSNGLKYYHEKLKPKESVQLVLNLRKPMDVNGIKVRKLADWLIQDLWT
jgi:uncharacterized protein